MYMRIIDLDNLAILLFGVIKLCGAKKKKSHSTKISSKVSIFRCPVIMLVLNEKRK